MDVYNFFTLHTRTTGQHELPVPVLQPPAPTNLSTQDKLLVSFKSWPDEARPTQAPSLLMNLESTD